jgi:hypothetical protein
MGARKIVLPGEIMTLCWRLAKLEGKTAEVVLDAMIKRQCERLRDDPKEQARLCAEQGTRVRYAMAEGLPVERFIDEQSVADLKAACNRALRDLGRGY